MFASCSKDRNIFVCQLGHTQPIRKYLGSPKGAGGHSDEVNAVRWLVTTLYCLAQRRGRENVCSWRSGGPACGCGCGRVGCAVGIRLWPVAHMAPSLTYHAINQSIADLGSSAVPTSLEGVP
jgi:hypothetical protein